MDRAPALRPIGFHYLRHGETEWNRLRLCQGEADIPLNDTGRAQAALAREALRGVEIGTVVASPLSRALETAEIVREAVSAPLVVIDDLREVSFGEFEGEPVGEWWGAWMAGAPVPGGVEPLEDFMARALRGVNEALTRPGPVLVVAHGGIFWSVQRHAPLDMDGTIANGVPVRLEPPNGGSAPWHATLLPAGKQ